jgi:hypothetical protein
MRTAAFAVVLLLLMSCDDKRVPVQERTLFFRGDPVAQIEERVEDDGLGKRVHRRVRLPNSEIVETNARVDGYGFLVDATYRRGEVRTVTFIDGKLSDGTTSIAVEGAVVAIDMLRHVQPAGRTAVTLVDLSSGDALAGRVDRQGASVIATDEKGGLIARCNVEGLCTGPGAFFEGDSAPSLDIAPVEPSLVAKGRPRALRLMGVLETLGALALDGPGQRAAGVGAIEYVDDAARPLTTPPNAHEREAALFIESNDAAVRTFAGTAGEPLADAARIADAVFPLVDPAATDKPPSAKAMLTTRGDCDGAAALVTASLRALGHAARPVVGYRFVEDGTGAGGRFVPHAWSEVYTPTGWVLIDATVPRVGGSADTYVKLFHGLGSALTMGRVLGRVRIEPATLPVASAAPAAGP